jgi:hypothetical protein
MILFYTTKLTARIAYIIKHLFTSTLGIPVTLTIDRKEFEQYEGPKINYTNEASSGIHIHPHSLLFEQNVQVLTPGISEYQNIPILFPVSETSSLPFDPFAAAFFMITRYEEYWPQPLDKFGRVLARSSVAYQLGFLEIPVVDHWALMVQHLVESTYPSFHFPKRDYKYMPTFDVDIAFAYRCRSVWRTTASTIKSILYQRFEDVQERFRVLLNNHPDPYDIFLWLHDFNVQHKISPLYFFQVGRYGRYDKNISPTYPAMKKLIRETEGNYQLGIHPSYRSGGNLELLKEEINTLENIIGKKVIQSRQHFLKLRFPETYKNLISCGITDDFTMGYASRPGFRAGTCTPFHFYDLSTETETGLSIHPFQIMDGTLNQYMHLSPLEAIDCISRINEEVRKVNGTFISLWHNESLSEIREWSGWQDVFFGLVRIANARTQI